MMDYVWYAGYGSNLNSSRFYYYIKGGFFKINGSNYYGCQDKTLPVRQSTYIINHELYFAKKCNSWENKSVAFLSETPNKAYSTKCVLYLITREQFTDVLIQENGLIPPIPEIVPNFEAARIGKNADIGMADKFRWYGRLLYLGELEDYPIYSFTSKDSMESSPVCEPGPNYLQVLGKGLIKNFGMSKNEVASYLIQQKGIDECDWTNESIIKLLNKPYDY